MGIYFSITQDITSNMNLIITIRIKIRNHVVSKQDQMVHGVRILILLNMEKCDPQSKSEKKIKKLIATCSHDPN